MFDRIIVFLQDFFSVSPKEARGITGLLLLSAMVLIFPVFLKHYLFYRTPEERAEERVFLDSLVRAARLEEQAEAGVRKESTTKSEFVGLKDFNPNTATEEEMISLGIPGFLARRIINYRQKGGIFRKNEDLRRIYDFPDELYQTLLPYIRLSPGSLNDADAEVPGKRPARDKPVKSDFVQEKKRQGVFNPGYQQTVIVPFDINKADTAQLKKLKGIGSGRARIILNYRNALGGFHSPSQYPEIYGLDTLSLSGLNQYARILSPPRKIAINAVSLDELLRHPYAKKHRKTSEAVIRYREQHGAYRSRDDLEKVINITPAFLDLLAPYLSFE